MADEEKNWSEKVEDLLDSGDTDSAITLLETLISHLESSSNSPQLGPALLELSKLYSSKGLSLKSDQFRSRSTSIQLLHSHPSTGVSSKECSRVSRDNTSQTVDFDSADKSSNHTNVEEVSDDDDDDWEAMADREPEELLSVVVPERLDEVVGKISLSDTKAKVAKRRGRGTFMYKKEGLYSDQLSGDDGEGFGYESPDEKVVDEKDEKVSGGANVYGTRHVLVLDGFDPSTTMTDLERLFENFRDRGFSIRWVNDTLALAVFRTPSTASEARDCVQCSFSVRVLEEDDSMMSSISVKDLDPPRQRPKTSARTAQRLIAQELGVKLPSSFGSKELRQQEDARRNRIVTRQNLRDEAWGPDDTK